VEQQQQQHHPTTNNTAVEQQQQQQPFEGRRLREWLAHNFQTKNRKKSSLKKYSSISKSSDKLASIILVI
jgi:hypothetical protein